MSEKGGKDTISIVLMCFEDKKRIGLNNLKVEATLKEREVFIKRN